MNSNTFRMPARRCAAATAAVALLAGPVALAGPAAATGSGAQGRASAVVLRAGLDVSLLDKTVQVPVNTSLNEVTAPASASRTALTVRLDGVDGGRPVQLARADVATARATTEQGRTEGYARLAGARVQLPGLPLIPLVEIGKATSRAVCAAGARPVAESVLLGPVKVLGKEVTLTAAGTTRVTAAGVGEVTLDLARKQIASTTAAATALELRVAVNPLKLNVAEVNGTVTLAKATCEAPRAAVKPPAEQPTEQPTERPTEQPTGPAKPETPQKPGIEPQGPNENLAETGGTSATAYIAGGAAVLLALGGGTVLVARNRARARARG
ncbi:SCO1860 family LAETG-anchored protein [Streptomyces clavuligerus]|uniref:SCO1860 family LAETG-anchored protein n=2 Tax=Streptomyces clavuligerus TaxID=1901 RepID=UPI0001851C09|nr:SCO1860 family LAETG-anchored protein [Streptomyces clavuligerus]